VPPIETRTPSVDPVFNRKQLAQPFGARDPNDLRALGEMTALRPVPARRCGSSSMWIAVLICGRLLTFFRPPFFH
jgi:hypothetical protein